MLRSSQPSVKENPSFSPLLQVSAHGRTGVRPLSAFLGQRQISFGQFRSAGIDQVEDFYHDIDALVLAGYLLLVEVPVEHLPEPGQPRRVDSDPRPGAGAGIQRFDLRLETPCGQRRDIDPPGSSRIVAGVQNAKASSSTCNRSPENARSSRERRQGAVRG
jgi:hypothetical protein